MMRADATDLPPDLHQQTLAIARDAHQTSSQTVTQLLRRGLGETPTARVNRDGTTGRLLLDVGQPIGDDNVRSLEDDE